MSAAARDRGTARAGHLTTGDGRATPPEPTPLAVTFDATGPAEAPAILFLHGTRLTRAMWQPQLALGDAYRLVIADLPGHGSLARTRFTLAGASRHVGRVIDAAAGGRAVVVGQSLGGYVAMDLAARRPGQVRALVLCGCTQEPRTLAVTAPGVVGRYLARAAAESRRGHRGPAGAPGAADPARLPDADQATDGWLFRGGPRALVTSIGLTFVPRLRAFTGPTLIVNGAGDRLFRGGEARFLAAAADGRLAVVEGAAHVPSQEASEAYNAIIRGFMEELDGR